MEIEYLPLGEIHPYPSNAKRHNPEQVATLASMIEAHGWDVPIVVDGAGIIIKGHGRRLAAEKLGLETVPVIRRTDLSDEQARAARIADNRVAHAPWDDAALQRELEELQQLGVDLSLTAFDQDELSGLLATLGDEAPPPALGDDEPAEPVEPSKPVIQYSVVFNDEGEQAVWYSFLHFVTEHYDGDTISQRLVACIRDRGLMHGSA